jgi:proline iminopeptidase
MDQKEAEREIRFSKHGLLFHKMKFTVFKLAGYSLLLLLIIFLTGVLWPRNYDVPKFQKRPGTQYWDLSTGSRIGYTLVPAIGDRKDYPVIYLHGGPGGSISETDISVLSPLSEDGYSIYFYDQVGSGQSNRLNNISEYTVERHKKDLLEIVNLTGSDKVILIGQSWGAILAILFAAENPGKVAKIILTSPGPVYPIRKELITVKAPDSLHLRAPYYTNQQGNMKANNLRTRAMAFFASNFSMKLANDEEADDFSTYLNSEVNKSTLCDTAIMLKSTAGSGFYSRIMTYKSLTQMPDARSKIRDINIPVLVMKGQCDNQYWGYTNEYLELIKNSRLAFIPAAGHFISIEKPGLYVSTIREFLTTDQYNRSQRAVRN